jgi:ABC-type glycerol-3-phosphate transport system permease component
MLPVVVFGIFLRRYLMRGLTAGASRSDAKCALP